jgi:hypothetical protein
MSHKFFISHCSKDKEIAELFSNVLRRITLDQISPWFSSDESSDNGLRPGDIWFNQILSKITQSKAVVALLTPNSINRPWIYFESGIGQALKECIIPVCIGVSRDSILPPLGLYQCYQLNDYRSVVEFFAKLLTLFQIRFDEEMSKIIIENLVSEISQIGFNVEENENIETVKTLIENFKNHIDKRFIETLENPKYIINENYNNIKELQMNLSNDNNATYSVLFDIDFPEFQNKNLFIDIHPDDTFQDLTNTIYFMISNLVKPYKYLEEWVIVEQETDRHVIIREIGFCIHATSIFRPNTKWKIVKLSEPFNVTDSSTRRNKMKVTNIN